MNHAEGLYKEQEDWELYRWRLVALVLLQPLFFLRSPIRYTSLLREALAACDQIISVTEYNKAILTIQFRIAPSRIEVVRINVDVDEYQPESIFVVLIVGCAAHGDRYGRSP